MVQVDKLGQAQAVAPASAGYRPTDPEIAWHLARFVEDVRSIPTDPVCSARTGCRPTTTPAKSGALALNDYARTDDPFAKLGREQVSVDVSSVIRASPDSFRVAWSERHYKDGALAETERWSAIVTVTLQVPHDPDRLRRNPLGIYVTALDWSKELG